MNNSQGWFLYLQKLPPQLVEINGRHAISFRDSLFLEALEASRFSFRKGFGVFFITVWVKMKQQKVLGHQYSRHCSNLWGSRRLCLTGLLSLMLIWQKDPSLFALNVKCWYFSFLSQSIQVEPDTDTHICVNCSLFCFLGQLSKSLIDEHNYSKLITFRLFKSWKIHYLYLLLH